jgi:hypothetical protein
MVKRSLTPGHAPVPRRRRFHSDQLGDTLPDRRAWARDFVIGWLAGLIFFGTMLS